ncbi:MFS transporter [Pseudomonas putida]
MTKTISTRKTWFAVATSGSGNLLEVYDFAVYAFFATTIAKLFFPNVDETTSLLQTFAAYGAGFIARPLGSYVIGRIGDKRGRKPAMLLTIICMAIGSIGIGLIPTYETIGVGAPILLVMLRCLQGFAAGGEWGTSASYIVEWSPAGRKGFFGSFQSVSSSGGFAGLASSLGALAHSC